MCIFPLFLDKLTKEVYYIIIVMKLLLLLLQECLNVTE